MLAKNGLMRCQMYYEKFRLLTGVTSTCSCSRVTRGCVPSICLCPLRNADHRACRLVTPVRESSDNVLSCNKSLFKCSKVGCFYSRYMVSLCKGNKPIFIDSWFFVFKYLARSLQVKVRFKYSFMGLPCRQIRWSREKCDFPDRFNGHLDQRNS